MGEAVPTVGWRWEALCPQWEWEWVDFRIAHEKSKKGVKFVAL